MDNLTGRVAVVTGAGDGIGRGIAHALAGAGARVAVVDIDRVAAERVAAEIEGSRAFQADVSDAAAMRALAAEVRSTLGSASILCNNAGVMLDGKFTESADTDWQWVFGVNVHGVVNGVQAFIDQLREHDEAQIVNTGSMAGLAPRLHMTLGIYSASKAAVVSYSEMLRSQLADEGIGVSVLCPSTVNTRIWEADRNRPAELGNGESVPKPDRAFQAIDGIAVGPLVVRGIRENRGYIFTSDDARERVETRTATILADIALHEADAS
jgi:NAD(P)-dependent dehydrogenase (short-subunit alcohol dehydrogenase family)